MEDVTSNIQLLANKVLLAPTISDLSNAVHDHTNDAGGGILSASCLSDPLTATNVHSTTVTATTVSAATFSGGSVTGLPGLLADDQHVLDSEVINLVYPVGSIYISTVPTNPGTLFGVGTWVAFGAGRTLVGLDAGQTEFDTVEETGGEKTHTLTVAEMPVHSHAEWGNVSNAGQAGTGVGPNTGAKNQPTENAGGGGAHNNLQPYIVVYMWKRTA
jgi:hypothetical protein